MPDVRSDHLGREGRLAMIGEADTIERNLDRLDAMRDDSTDAEAQVALAELLATVAQINAAVPTFRSAATPTDTLGGEELVDRLTTWIKRLADRLSVIVKSLDRATSFSITVGTSLSVTVTFGPFEAVSK
ncbi:MAG TPA: hypothetical protein VE441_09420 [Mycobacterium sp.]|nr:hypothetical protein [Mycobacterium sp.]